VRPSISDQLRGSSRILAEVVAPGTTSPYAAEVLRGVIKNLQMLESAWPSVLPFILWDNAGTRTLLGEARGVVDLDLLSAPEPHGEEIADFVAMEKLNLALREDLVRIVRALDPDQPQHARLEAKIAAHLRERVARYPLRMAVAMPAAS
jgi:hypothetical protein